MSVGNGAGILRQVSRCIIHREAAITRGVRRYMATETSPATPLTNDATPTMTTTAEHNDTSSNSLIIYPLQHRPPPNPFITDAHCTLHTFPGLEPTGFVTYPSTHLQLPLRKDILHLAVTYEADASRQGTASTKWRDDVHGSGRKVRPQKGTGRARLGDKKSPMLRGGGVAFGPKPRDFSTDLSKKVYDLAWRTALSYRYRRGQLLVLEGEANIKKITQGSRARYLDDMLRWHNMGKEAGRTLIVTKVARPAMVEAFEDEKLKRAAELLELEDVDVKDLLELGRIVIERKALEKMLELHQSDLVTAQQITSFEGRASQSSPPSLDITSSMRT